MQPSPFDARIAVSIVNYGTSDLVLENVPRVLEELSRFAEGALFIVDNASPDDDGARLAEGLAAMGSPAAVHLILSPRNGGFAAGNNMAFAAAKALDWTPDAILLLNPDCELRPDAIVELVRVMQARPKVGMVGARLENEQGEARMAAYRFPSMMNEFARELGLGPAQRRWPVLIAETDIPARADWVTGAAVLFNQQVIDTLGPMDEEYFLYYEEVDYQLQAHRAGWEIWYAPDARVMHISGVATGIVGGVAKIGPTPAYWFDSWRRFFEKNHGGAYASAAGLMKLAGMGLGALANRLRGRPVNAVPRFVPAFFRRCCLNIRPAYVEKR